jgi:hypothetical protein
MKKTQLTASAATGSYSVSWPGALRAVHGGDVSGKVPLQQFHNDGYQSAAPELNSGHHRYAGVLPLH